jgi:hypothetical protein
MNTAIAAVLDLNSSFFDITSVEDYAPFRFESDGLTEHVFFMGVHVWRDDEDEREEDEAGNLEELSEFLMRRAREVLANLWKWEP